jgi:multicomponent Na+:H+ antiporter subunit B
MEAIINMVLLTLLALVTAAIIRQRSLIGVVILAGIYSFLMASVMIVLDAVDVALTEASVGAGISTVLLLGALHLTKTREISLPQPKAGPILLSLAVGGALVWGALVLPSFGDPNAAIHMHVAPYYLERAVVETNVPNIVTAILADYRGFDTLGETIVIFTAGIGVLLLLKGLRRRGAGADEAPSNEDEKSN